MENYLGSKYCSCRRQHDIAIGEVVVGKGVIRRLPEFVARYQSGKPFLPADKNTHKAAGGAAADILRDKYVLHGIWAFWMNCVPCCNT